MVLVFDTKAAIAVSDDVAPKLPSSRRRFFIRVNGGKQRVHVSGWEGTAPGCDFGFGQEEALSVNTMGSAPAIGDLGAALRLGLRHIGYDRPDIVDQTPKGT